MGNLGRPGYGATLDGTWPYTQVSSSFVLCQAFTLFHRYDSCDVGTLPNQTDQNGPSPAGLSYLPGQKLSCASFSSLLTLPLFIQQFPISFPLAPALVQVRIIQDPALPQVVVPRRSIYSKQAAVVWSHSRPLLPHLPTIMYTLMTPSKSGMCTILTFLNRIATSTFSLLHATPC
jgi:hypothetical protein